MPPLITAFLIESNEKSPCAKLHKQSSIVAVPPTPIPINLAPPPIEHIPPPAALTIVRGQSIGSPVCSCLYTYIPPSNNTPEAIPTIGAIVGIATLFVILLS